MLEVGIGVWVSSSPARRALERGLAVLDRIIVHDIDAQMRRIVELRIADQRETVVQSPRFRNIRAVRDVVRDLRPGVAL